MTDSQTPDSDEDQRRRRVAGPGLLAIPAWAAAISIVLSWAAGVAILTTELFGQGRVSVLGLAAWLITLPVVAFDPIEAIRVAIHESIGNRRRP
jgi:hypothetical protein